MDDRRFLDVPGRSTNAPGDRDDVVVWCRGPVERHTSAVLLVHDRLANARSWDVVIGRLPAGVAVVAVDLRGRGSAWRQQPSFGLASHVADIGDTLDRLDIDEVLVVGQGYGAEVGAALAVAAPDRVPLTVGVLGHVEDHPFDAVLGMAFPNRDEHLRFWTQHPRFASADPRAVEGFVGHGIAGPEDHHRWRVDLRSLVADDREPASTEPSRFSRSILIGPASGGNEPTATTHLANADPAAALLTSAGADAIVAQVLPMLQ